MKLPGSYPVVANRGPLHQPRAHPASEIIDEHFTAKNTAFCSHYRAYDISCNAPARLTPVYDGNFEGVAFPLRNASQNPADGTGWSLGSHVQFVQQGSNNVFRSGTATYTAFDGSKFEVMLGDPGKVFQFSQVVLNVQTLESPVCLMYAYRYAGTGDINDTGSCFLRATYGGVVVDVREIDRLSFGVTTTRVAGFSPSTPDGIFKI